MYDVSEAVGEVPELPGRRQRVPSERPNRHVTVAAPRLLPGHVLFWELWDVLLRVLPLVSNVFDAVLASSSAVPDALLAQFLAQRLYEAPEVVRRLVAEVLPELAEKVAEAVPEQVPGMARKRPPSQEEGLTLTLTLDEATWSILAARHCNT